jgi:hypothetical protein
VPPDNIPNAAILRNYINQRFDDTWDSGGVRDKMVQWYVILKTIPSQFGGGGAAVQVRRKQEWSTLTALLDQGNPQPIALLFDDWSIFNNHQVVAYGYGGDPYSGPAYLNIYDNRAPNREFQIRFDFTQSEMQGTIMDSKGNRYVIGTAQDGQPVYDEFLKGFFTAIYTPKTPPLSWGVQNGMTAQPSTCQSAKETFAFTAPVANSFTFFQSESSTTITPVVSDPWTMQVAPANYASAPGVDASGSGPIALAASESFNNPGKAIVVAKAFVQVTNQGNVVPDDSGKALACFRNLPALNSFASASAQLQVLDRLQIEALNRGGSTCYFPYVEGSDVTVRLKQLPFPGSNLSYQWQVAGATAGATNKEQVEISGLPGSTVMVTVQVVNKDMGCIAVGDLAIKTYTGVQADRFASFCQLTHIVSHFTPPGFTNPLGPDDPAFTTFVQNNLAQLRQDAARILRLTEHLDALERER